MSTRVAVGLTPQPRTANEIGRDLEEYSEEKARLYLRESLGEDDYLLLALAAGEGRALLTNNHRDFVRIARSWSQSGREHAGIILSTQLPRGELLRQVETLLERLTVDELRNTVRWLQEFR
jgi:hypothetical protein